MITGGRWNPKRSLITHISIAVLLGITVAIYQVCSATSVEKTSNSSGTTEGYNSSTENRRYGTGANKEETVEDLGLATFRSSTTLGTSAILKRSNTDASPDSDRSSHSQSENRQANVDNHEHNPQAEEHVHPKEAVSSVHVQVLSPEENEIAQNVPFANNENKETVVTSSSGLRVVRQPHALQFSTDYITRTFKPWTEDYSKFSATFPPITTYQSDLWPSSGYDAEQWYSQIADYQRYPFRIPVQYSSEEVESSQFHLQKPTWGFASPVCDQEECLTFRESGRTVSYPQTDYDYNIYKDFDFTRISTSLQTKTHKDPLDDKDKLVGDSIQPETSPFASQRTLDSSVSSLPQFQLDTFSNHPDLKVSSTISAKMTDEYDVNTNDEVANGNSTANNDTTFSSLFYETVIENIGIVEPSYSKDLNGSIWDSKELSDRIIPTKVTSSEVFFSVSNRTHYDSPSLEGFLPHLMDSENNSTQHPSSATYTGATSTVIIFGEMYPIRDKESDVFNSERFDSISTQMIDGRTNILASFYTGNDVFPTQSSTDGIGIVYEEDTSVYWWPADVMVNNTQAEANATSTSSINTTASFTHLKSEHSEYYEPIKSTLFGGTQDLKNSPTALVVSSPPFLLSSEYPTSTESWTTGLPVTTTVAFGAVPRVTKDSTLNTRESTTEYPKEAQPSCNTVSVCILVTLSMTWAEFCSKIEEFRKYLSDFLSQYAKPILPRQIVLSNFHECEENSDNEVLVRRRRHQSIVIQFFVTNKDGVYDGRMTEICGYILKKGEPVKGTLFSSKVTDIQLYHRDYQETVTENSSSAQTNTGIIAAVTISAIAGACLFLLCIMLVLMKQRLAQARHCNPSMDAYSLDSFSVSASFRRRRGRQSMRSFINHGFDDPELPSRPLNFAGLANRIANKESLEEEFKVIPMNMPRIDQVPAGAEAKNRYANVIPIPETRVVLSSQTREANSDYINGNYVKGYGGKAQTYIACQAPLPETIEDFWRMVWEQQSKIIIMITQLDENNVSRCAPYFPESTLDCHMLFGDYQVSLQKKDMREHYIMSTFRLYELEKNLFREVIHFWYTAWPPQGVPQDSGNLINFLLYVRPYISSNSGPAIVHCSPGTGRTGVLIALDICMKEYEESQSVDILRCIVRLRADRGGAVQTKEQYIFIHEAMHEYASRLANQSHRPSVKSNT